MSSGLQALIPERVPWNGAGSFCPACFGDKSNVAIHAPFWRWRVDAPESITCPYCDISYPHADYPEVTSTCRAHLRSSRRGRYRHARFDFTGLGESEGDFADTHFSSNVDDLLAAARHLESSGQGPDLLVGHSLGAAAVLMAAGRIASCRAVATIGAPSHPDHITRLLTSSREEFERDGEARVQIAGRSFTIRREFLHDLEGVPMGDTIGPSAGRCSCSMLVSTTSSASTMRRASSRRRDIPRVSSASTTLTTCYATTATRATPATSRVE